MSNQNNPKTLYQSRLESGELKPDPVQQKAVDELERLYQELLAYKPRKRRWFSKKEPPPSGVYFYGGVGRGKSMLMDLFYECLPKDIPAQRVHFHEFMISVHDYHHERRSADFCEGMDGIIPLFAARIAEQSRVLCFDEFHVVDVADAMILGRLYRCLLEQGVVIVSTSNWEPDRLYEDGLQRDRFLPFINLIKEKMHVFHLDSPHDYRTQFLMEEGRYFSPLGPQADQHMDTVFKVLSDGIEPQAEVLTVKGREIKVSATAKGIARFSFSELCERPLGAEDYLKISDTYHSVLLGDVPHMGQENRNEMKRFMNLVDVLYENNTRLIMSADAKPEALYTGEDHAYEFKRTISRLQEMQSAEYLDRGDDS